MGRSLLGGAGRLLERTARQRTVAFCGTDGRPRCMPLLASGLPKPRVVILGSGWAGDRLARMLNNGVCAPRTPSCAPLALRPAHGNHLAAALAAAAAAMIREGRLYLDSCIDASSAAAAGASLVSGSFGLGGRGTATDLGTAGLRDVAGVGARREEGTVSGALVGLPVRGVTVRAGAAERGDAIRAGGGATAGAGSCSSSGKGTSSASKVSTRCSRPRWSSAACRFCFWPTCSRSVAMSAFSSSSAASF